MYAYTYMNGCIQTDRQAATQTDRTDTQTDIQWHLHGDTQTRTRAHPHYKCGILVCTVQDGSYRLEAPEFRQFSP